LVVVVVVVQNNNARGFFALYTKGFKAKQSKAF
jgi:hypothetical protein